MPIRVFERFVIAVGCKIYNKIDHNYNKRKDDFPFLMTMDKLDIP